jgi:hypothetical protein
MGALTKFYQLNLFAVLQTFHYRPIPFNTKYVITLISLTFQMHVEAAKMLAFSEEEFVKALEWGS